MRAHTDEDAKNLTEILAGDKDVICDIHGVIPINLIAPYFWPSQAYCPLCVAEYLTDKFPVDIVERRNKRG